MTDLSTAELYQRFLSWQCRLRKLSMRELGGRPTAGMSAGVYAVCGGDEQSRMNFLIMRRETGERTKELRHIVRKTPDSAEWMKHGLRILAERHYHDEDQFENRLTALFGLESTLGYALIEAGQCRLRFAEGGIEHEFTFDVELLDPRHPLFEATYWHNHLFNPALPGKVNVLACPPRL